MAGQGKNVRLRYVSWRAQQKTSELPTNSYGFLLAALDDACGRRLVDDPDDDVVEGAMVALDVFFLRLPARLEGNDGDARSRAVIDPDAVVERCGGNVLRDAVVAALGRAVDGCEESSPPSSFFAAAAAAAGFFHCAAILLSTSLYRLILDGTMRAVTGVGPRFAELAEDDNDANPSPFRGSCTELVRL